MKKYPFPPGVTQMSGPDYAEHCRAMGAAEKAAKVAKAARRAEVAKPGPGTAARIKGLAVGASVTLAGYKRTTQVSSAIRRAYVDTGARYTSALAHDLLTGETVTGVTVTRTG